MGRGMILSIGEKIIITVIAVILTILSGAYNFSKCAELSVEYKYSSSVFLRFMLTVVTYGTVPSLMMYFLWR